jgi:predicted nucleotidyltransferase
MVAGTRVESYVATIAEVVESAGPRVVGTFVLGSALLGGFDPTTSDLDVVVIVSQPLDAAEREAVVAALDELSVPFRKLELVLYAEGARPPAFELNYPDGDGEPAFWFVLDAAIAQEHAQALTGRPWGDLVEPVSEDETRRAAADMLRWGEERGDETGRLHAVRARHYLDYGGWITKEEARA